MNLLKSLLFVGLIVSLTSCTPEQQDPTAPDGEPTSAGISVDASTPSGTDQVDPVSVETTNPPAEPPVLVSPQPEESKEPEATAAVSGGRAINLSIKDSGQTISAGVGDLVIIELQANPTTGYQWQVAELAEESILILKSEQYLTLAQLNPEMQPAIGQGGMKTYTYQVTKPGKAEISLAYLRPWEKDVEPDKTFKVTIEATETTSPVVTGQLIFSDPPDVEKISRVTVSIRNTALADGPAPLIGTVELKPPFKLPITFAVPYDPAKVSPNPMFYSISARVQTMVGGSEKLYYINDTHHSVFATADDTKRDIAVKKIR